MKKKTTIVSKMIHTFYPKCSVFDIHINMTPASGKTNVTHISINSIRRPSQVVEELFNQISKPSERNDSPND